MSQMSDEILFLAIQMQATQITQYARDIKRFVDKFEVGNAGCLVPHLKQVIEGFEKLILEVKEIRKV